MHQLCLSVQPQHWEGQEEVGQQWRKLDVLLVLDFQILLSAQEDHTCLYGVRLPPLPTLRQHSHGTPLSPYTHGGWEGETGGVQGLHTNLLLTQHLQANPS